MAFWDRAAPLYDWSQAANRQAVRGMVREAARRVPPGGSFLECAAGTGEISLAAASQAGSVLCTDLSPSMLKQAEAKAHRLGLDSITFAARDLLHLPEEDRSFDAVCAANVLHLLEDPAAAVRELWRVTDGILILPTFLSGEASGLMRGLLSLYRLAGFRQKRSFTIKSYQAFFHSLGMFPAELTVIPGRLPVGLAVFQKEASS